MHTSMQAHPVGDRDEQSGGEGRRGKAEGEAETKGGRCRGEGDVQETGGQGVLGFRPRESDEEAYMESFTRCFPMLAFSRALPGPRRLDATRFRPSSSVACHLIRTRQF